MSELQGERDCKNFGSLERSTVSKLAVLGALAAGTFVGGDAAIIHGQQVPNPPSPPQPHATGPTHRFKVPSGRMQDILPSFERAAGIHVALASSALGDLQSPGVTGEYSTEEALQQLLAGTNVGYRFTSQGIALLNLASVSQTVTVHADPADPFADPEAPYKAELSSHKLTESVLNTPKTETILTHEALEDKDATTLRDVLRSTAGVTLGSGEGGNAFGDRFFIRGFDARNDVFVDGVRDPGVGIRENFDDEQIEILRGPSSSFAGRGTTGGALNIVTKEAQPDTYYHFEGEGGFNDERRRGAADYNRALSRTTDIRLNGLVQYANVAGRDYATDNRWGAAGNLAFHPNDKLSATFNFSHTYLWGLPDFGVPYNQVERTPVTQHDVRRTVYYGATNRDFTKSAQDLGTADVEYRVNDRITLSNKFRGSDSLLNYIGTIPENPSCTGATAIYCSTPTHYSGYVQLNAQSRYEPVGVENDQPEATFRFDTGKVHHAAVAGAEFSSERIGIQGYSGLTSELTTGPVVVTSSGAPIVSVTNPVNIILGSAPIKLAGNPLRYNVATKATYLVDTANFHDVVLLNGGIRYDNYHIHAANDSSSRDATSNIPSYNAGLTLKPTRISSVYFAFASAAEPVGDELDATSSSYGGFAATQNATQIFGPQTSKSYELGTKWEVLDRHLLLSGALFNTDVNNARETVPNGFPGYTSGTIVPNAAYRVRGVDLEAAGKIRSQWSVLGGLVIMDPKVTKSIVPTNVGLQLANIAPQSFNFLTKYQVTHRLELGGQSVFASQIKGGSLLAANGSVAYPGTPNPTLLPSYWRFDFFVESQLNRFTTLKVQAQNVFDRKYYDSFYQSAQPFIAIGPGRAVYVNLVFRPRGR